MKRLTTKKDGSYHVDEDSIERGCGGYSGEAIERLGMFENACERIEAEQKEIAGELEKLREQGKQKSVKFNQLLAKKLMNTHIISMFESQGINI